jgi:molecular chaperone IbpA
VFQILAKLGEIKMTKDFEHIVNALLYPDRFAKTFGGGSVYPPYNIIRVDENETVLEVAVAGFKETELQVIAENGMLKVSGKKTNADIANYAYKGIGARNFERSFSLDENSVVAKAEYADGILSVYIKMILPENKGTNTIPIGKGNREYLTERSDIV